MIISAIPVLTALVDALQISSGFYPHDSPHLAVAPISWLAHAWAGVAFGVCGPLQFVRALKGGFGMLHRTAGWIFVLSGAALALSGISLLLQVTPQRTAIIDVGRGIFGLALLLTLFLAVVAIRKRDVLSHRAWVIRAYAVGMGLGTASLVFFPIYLVTGHAPTGFGADALFVGSWALNIGLAEAIVRNLRTTAKGSTRAAG
ncbi:DUF2306 domain-containing protein [Brevundimonas sp.]|uniref:DUF2306 domain-containing protein n=1 Tax=Brevundimonas sp. TaxID=1871086 RepID=UPI002E11E8CB|nr:DUF2306 domain-containing protein [Brevundimonas sp.]